MAPRRSLLVAFAVALGVAVPAYADDAAPSIPIFDDSDPPPPIPIFDDGDPPPSIPIFDG